MYKISSLVGVPRETTRLELHKLGVQMRHVYPIYSLPRSILDVDSATLLGIHAGDGWISGRWGIAIHSTDTQMAAEVARLAREVLGVEPSVRTYGDHTTVVSSCKKQVLEFFTRYGYPQGRKAATVAVPSVIFGATDEVKRAFLRGLFSADGCFYWKGTRGEIRLEVASRSLRDDFVTLGSQLGFNFRQYTYIHRGGHNKLPLNLAYLGQQPQVLRWMKEVGSICDTHLTRYHNMLSLLQDR